jgi:hypothetical protein
MGERRLEIQKTVLERRIAHEAWDFAGTYLAVSDLHQFIKSRPTIGSSETIHVLAGVLNNRDFTRETQSLFLYREAAEALVTLVVHSRRLPVAAQALATLKHFTGAAQGPSQRASTEALGSLPLAIQGPAIEVKATDGLPRLTWSELLDQNQCPPCDSPALFGRSLVAETKSPEVLLVVKLAQDEQAAQLIHQEANWMEYLHSRAFSFPVRFSVPIPIKIQESYLFELDGIPTGASQARGSRTVAYSMAFLAPKDYFAYPNDQRLGKEVPPQHFFEVMSRNAWLFGKLTAQGIVHTAPIPLFHNRVQRDRRQDGGYYEWERGGRLDRWFHSCEYPNFGASGIRDLEHVISFAGSSRRLYSYVGTQLLSLLLTAGSYFRKKDVTRFGLDEQGKPVDARDLFDKPFFQELIQNVFCKYYEAFTGEPLEGKLPFSLDSLVCRMIDEMGVDHHMEEILRVVDQAAMSDSAFQEFLLSRGYNEERITILEKGKQDIVLHTGPHLGGFNERISLPEMIEAIGTMSALCIAGKFWTMRTAAFARPEPPLEQIAQAF